MYSGLKIVEIHGIKFKEFHRSAVTQDLFVFFYIVKREKNPTKM